MANQLATTSRQAIGLKVLVRTLGGSECEVLACLDSTVSELKRVIEEKLHVPAAQQRLFHGCKPLQDGSLKMAALSTSCAAGPGAAPTLELALLVRSPADAKMLEAVYQNPWLLKSASPELRGDEDVVLQAVRSHAGALEYATKELRGDRGFILQAVVHNGWVLKYASAELKGDREVVLRAVTRDGWALRYAAEELKADRGVVLQAVRSCGSALLCAHSELQGDRELALLAGVTGAERPGMKPAERSGG